MFRGTCRYIGVCLIAVFALMLGGCSGTMFETLLVEVEKLEVSPGNLSIAKGTSTNLVATLIYSDGKKKDVTLNSDWTSSNSTLVSLESNGTARGRFPGTVTVTATFKSISGSATLAVTSAYLLNIEVTPGSKEIAENTTYQFYATGLYSDNTSQDHTSSVTWTSSDTTNATIDSSGLATSVSDGSTTITGTYQGFSDIAILTVKPSASASLVQISVTPDSQSIAVNTKQQYAASGLFSDSTMQDMTGQVTWASDDTSIATIDSSGMVTGIAEGTAIITGTNGSTFKTIDCDYINASNVVTTTDTSGLKIGMGVTVTGNDPVPADTYIITIDNATQFKISKNAINTTPTVSTTISYGGGTTIEVKAASVTLSSISITPDNPIAYGTNQQFTATGLFSDNSTQDLSTQVIWESLDTATATISNASGNEGLANSVASGTTKIFAYTEIDLGTISGTFSNGSAIVTVADTTNLKEGMKVVHADIPANTLISSIDNATQFTMTKNATADQTGVSLSIKHGGGTTLEVRIITLASITINPATTNINKGQSQQFYATGIYSDGTNQDLTTQVLWSSSNTSVLDISNAANYSGLSTASLTNDGTVTVTATRDFVSGTANLTVLASDTTNPSISGALSLAPLPGPKGRIRVTFSEDMNILKATDKNYYKIADPGTLNGTCGAGNNFTGSTQTGHFNITDISVVSLNTYILILDNGTQATTYTVIGDDNEATTGDYLADLSGNKLTCPNSADFVGVDTVPPYLVSAISNKPNSIIVKFSEDMKEGSGATAADNITNYTLMESPSNESYQDPNITSITTIDARTFQLNLDVDSVGPIKYKIEVNSGVTDLAATPNLLTEPKYLTFIGNERIKLVAAEALTLTTIKVTFSKVLVASSAECSNATDCGKLYKITPTATTPASIGDITGAIVGSGNNSNTVTLTHATDQLGIVYTVLAANRKDGDNFDNVTDDKSIQGYDANNDPEDLQAQPKDRGSFIGLGQIIDGFEDGEYFTDPFFDGTSFSFAFTYGSRVYLGTNDINENAFRFDPNGYNSILVTFETASKSCTSAIGFGYGAGDTCGTNQGFNAERGVVGFTSVTVNVPVAKSGSGENAELLLVGTLKDGVDKVYFTQDLDTELDWNQFNFVGTGGGNTKSIQTIYGCDEYIYAAAASEQSPQAPVVSVNEIRESSGVISIFSSTDMSIRGIAEIGKNTDNYKGTNEVIGIDSIIKYPFDATGKLYMANNGGIRYSSDFVGLSSSSSATPSAFTGETLVLPLAANGGLEKLSPGQRGIPWLFEYNNKLDMARNVAVSSAAGDRNTPSRGELWKCTPGVDGACDPADWQLIIAGTESDLPSTNSISMIKSNGSNILYVGFDDYTTPTPTGVRIYRIVNTEPTATNGTDITGPGWVKQGPVGSENGLGGGYTKIFSFSSITDGSDYYFYVTVGNGTQAIRVFRKID